MTHLMPALFFGHGNPMNALSRNQYTEAWETIEQASRDPRRFCASPRTTAIMRIAIYGRVSTEKQDTQNQLVQLRAFAVTQGWTVVREYVDIASGKSGDRQQFKALFAAASRREMDSVLVHSGLRRDGQYRPENDPRLRRVSTRTV